MAEYIIERVANNHHFVWAMVCTKLCAISCAVVPTNGIWIIKTHQTYTHTDRHRERDTYARQIELWADLKYRTVDKFKQFTSNSLAFISLFSCEHTKYRFISFIFGQILTHVWRPKKFHCVDPIARIYIQNNGTTLVISWCVCVFFHSQCLCDFFLSSLSSFVLSTCFKRFQFVI